MFDSLMNRASSSPDPEPPRIRDLLFGDLPASEWPRGFSTGQPWCSFVEARNHREAGETDEAVRLLRGILAMPALESRHYLQAWHFLRALGIEPSDEEGKRLYGVVVEVGLEQGLDIVAAYADRSARYFNYSGAAEIWERPDDRLDRTIDELLEEGGRVVAQIGPWEGERPSAPAAGQVRITMLTPSGLHFGQGEFEVLAGDPLGGPVISSAMKLMMALIEHSEGLKNR
jgi:hypothetical protein